MDWLVGTPGELAVRGAFLVELFLLAVIRVYFHAKVGTLNESPFSAAEGVSLSIIRVISGLLCVGSLLTALTLPQLLATTTLALPLAVRAIGPLLFGVCLLGLIWVHQTLGRNFSPTLHVREGNTLVEDGPYKWVRHPMYTVMVGCVSGMILATGNLVVAIGGLATMSVVIFFRTPKEEEMMIQEFGTAYEEYRQRTGAIFPKLLA